MQAHAARVIGALARAADRVEEDFGRGVQEARTAIGDIEHELSVVEAGVELDDRTPPLLGRVDEQVGDDGDEPGRIGVDHGVAVAVEHDPLCRQRVAQGDAGLLDEFEHRDRPRPRSGEHRVGVTRGDGQAVESLGEVTRGTERPTHELDPLLLVHRRRLERLEDPEDDGEGSPQVAVGGGRERRLGAEPSLEHLHRPFEQLDLPGLGVDEPDQPLEEDVVDHGPLSHLRTSSTARAPGLTSLRGGRRAPVSSAG